MEVEGVASVKNANFRDFWQFLIFFGKVLQKFQSNFREVFWPIFGLFLGFLTPDTYISRYHTFRAFFSMKKIGENFFCSFQVMKGQENCLAKKSRVWPRLHVVCTVSGPASVKNANFRDFWQFLIFFGEVLQKFQSNLRLVFAKFDLKMAFFGSKMVKKRDFRVGQLKISILG